MSMPQALLKLREVREEMNNVRDMIAAHGQGWVDPGIFEDLKKAKSSLQDAIETMKPGLILRYLKVV